jgi:mono/diheme cytochrome c family protein
MTRKMLSFAVVSLLLTFSFAALSSVSADAIQKKSTAVTEGRKLFVKHCASCHGEDGKGYGPVAPTLKTIPADLTRIPAENGKFPTSRIEEKIAGEQMSAVHGTREMPVWGSIFRQKGEGMVKLELYNLVKYLESIQQK